MNYCFTIFNSSPPKSEFGVPPAITKIELKYYEDLGYKTSATWRWHSQKKRSVVIFFLLIFILD